MTSSWRTPTVMIAWSASSPQVASTTNSCASLAEAKVWVAPKTVAISRLNGTGSTTTTRSAPARAAPWTALLPTPPAPKITTVSPACTPAACTALPQPVGTPQPTRAATSNGRSSGILMTEYSLTTACCEKVPSTHRPPKSSPFWWNRNVPSGNSPVEAFLPSSQRFCRPVEQYRHLPQAGMKEQTTWSPTCTLVTPGPTASTIPAPSCPPTTGKRIIASPFWMWSSEWHSPAAMNLMRTSFGWGSSSSSSVISHGLPGSRQTAARVVMLIGTPFLDRTSAPVYG